MVGRMGGKVNQGQRPGSAPEDVSPPRAGQRNQPPRDPAPKIIVPAHWEVRSEVTAMFAGFEDKRQQPAITNPDKVLILDGTSIFGGIELKNF